MIRALALALPLAAAATGASAFTIDFGESGSPSFCTASASGVGPAVACANSSYVLQSYGDVAGVVDVTYVAPRVGSDRSLRWWNTAYNNLYGVLWADGSDGDSLARIEFRAVNPADTVSLSAFTLGAYSNTTRGTTVTITTLDGVSLFSFAGPVGQGSTAATAFAPAVSAVGGLVLEWKDSAYNVGIDRISYAVTPVPEPAALALMLAGLGVVGAAARRRQG